MLETVVLFGMIIFAGIAAVILSCPDWMRNLVLKHHVLSTLAISGFTLWIHFGTMTGLMSATVAGLVTSMACWFGRWWWRIA